MTTQLIFRSAGISDLSAIEALAHKIWHEHYPAIITTEQIKYMLEKIYSQASLKNQIIVENHGFTLAFENENLIGFLDANSEDGKIFFMHKLYIDSFYHGKNIAKQLFNFVFSERRNLKAIRLQVNRKNSRAINFYKKLGFVIECEKDFNIGKGFYMLDYVMLKNY